MSVAKSNQSFNSSMELPYALQLVLNAAEKKELDFGPFISLQRQEIHRPFLTRNHKTQQDPALHLFYQIRTRLSDTEPIEPNVQPKNANMVKLDD